MNNQIQVTFTAEDLHDLLSGIVTTTARQAMIDAYQDATADPESKRQEHLAARAATVRRAIAHIEATDLRIVRNQLATIGKPGLNPETMLPKLREYEQLETAARFGVWKAAQNICRAAGLEH